MASNIMKVIRSAAAALVMLSTPLKAQTPESQPAPAAQAKTSPLIEALLVSYRFKEITEEPLLDPTANPVDNSGGTCVPLVAVMVDSNGLEHLFTWDELQNES